VHDAAVQGDTVGDPFKDTAGFSLNILVKLMSVIALVLAPLFAGVEGGLFFTFF
jgi:K(+)-stimulated pyrophosphate-energized sodium pump